MTLKELMDKRMQTWKQAQEIHAKAEGRGFTAEEQGQWDKIDAELDELDNQIHREEQMQRRAAFLNEELPRQCPQERPGAAQQRSQDAEYRSSPEYRNAFWHSLGVQGIDRRALTVGADTTGGYLVAPSQFQADVIKGVDAQLAIYAQSTKFRLIQAKAMSWPKRTARARAFARTTETSAGSADTTLRTGLITLTPGPAAGYIEVSNTLLEQGVIPVEQFVRDELIADYSELVESEAMTGDGNDEMLGIFTASASGISTARDVATGNTTTAIGADGLISAQTKLKSGYWKDARWVFHQDAIGQIRKLKDTNTGQFLWVPGLSGGVGNTILGMPYDLSDYCPNTFTAGNYVGCLGVYRYYYIVEVMPFKLAVARELKLLDNLTVFAARTEVDGGPVLEEAFVRVKLASG